MGLFIKKPLADLMTEANDSGSKSLKRILGPWSLIALGVGVIIGAGLFSITGAVAAGYTGPAITLSFAIAALGCCFAGLCYAEFVAPRVGAWIETRLRLWQYPGGLAGRTPCGCVD